MNSLRLNVDKRICITPDRAGIAKHLVELATAGYIEAAIGRMCLTKIDSIETPRADM